MAYQHSEIEGAGAVDVLILGGGVAGQRLGANKWFDPEVVGQEVAKQMGGHIYDPNLPLRKFDDLDHMQSALDEGRLTISRGIPSDRHFDVAYIASPTGVHVESLAQVNGLGLFGPQNRPTWTILEKPAVSGIHEENWLQTLIESGQVDENGISVHEPYLLSHGLQRMRNFIAEQREAGNPPTDINVWSAKDRTADVAAGRTGNEPELGAFGVEFPHTHAAASLLAGVELSSEHTNTERNIYYTSVDNNPLSEATYTEFTHAGTTIRVAQGLGPFIMSSEGQMFASRRPGITRAAEVSFANGQRVHLNLLPAVDRYALTQTHPYRHTVWRTYNTSGVMGEPDFIPDYPIKTLITNVLNKLRAPDTPSLPGIGIIPSLARCIAIRKLREQAQIKHNIPLPVV